MHKQDATSPHFPTTDENTITTKMARPEAKKRSRTSERRKQELANLDAYRQRAPIASHRAREAIVDFEAANPGMTIKDADWWTLKALARNYAVDTATMGFVVRDTIRQREGAQGSCLSTAQEA